VPEGETEVGPPRPPRPLRNSKEEAEKLPLIRRAIEVLGATVQKVDEGFGSSARNGPDQNGTDKEG